ncbi:hypothetical protein [Paenibacillus sp. DMB20]|uniref:hypothetical protein n=1 Tax=Paenibacillus sp. DMB20 TaxID=1642570 RepID=UPI000AACD817|nr:hypothetical protein [Paenibacillus sp. DMB20]
MNSLADIIDRLNRMGIDPSDLNSEIEQLENEINIFLKGEGLKCQPERSNLMNANF